MTIIDQDKLYKTKAELEHDMATVSEPAGWTGDALVQKGGFITLGQVTSGLPTVAEAQALPGWKAVFDRFTPESDVKNEVTTFCSTYEVPAEWYGLADYFGITYPLVGVFKQPPMRALAVHKDRYPGHKVNKFLDLPKDYTLTFDRLHIALEEGLLGQDFAVNIDGTVCNWRNWNQGDIAFTRTRLYEHWTSNSSMQERYTLVITGLFTNKTWEMIESGTHFEVDFCPSN